MLQMNFFIVKNNDQHIISKCKYSLKIDFKAQHFNIVLFSYMSISILLFIVFQVLNSQTVSKERLKEKETKPSVTKKKSDEVKHILKEKSVSDSRFENLNLFYYTTSRPVSQGLIVTNVGIVNFIFETFIYVCPRK